MNKLDRYFSKTLTEGSSPSRLSEFEYGVLYETQDMSLLLDFLRTKPLIKARVYVHEDDNAHVLGGNVNRVIAIFEMSEGICVNGEYSYLIFYTTTPEFGYTGIFKTGDKLNDILTEIGIRMDRDMYIKHLDIPRDAFDYVVTSKSANAFWKYFEDCIDYIGDEMSGEILPWNVLWNYVPSTFTDGVINHFGKPIYCGLYLNNEDLGDLDEVIKIPDVITPAGDTTFFGTRKDYIKALCAGKMWENHTHFHHFGCECIILTKMPGDCPDTYGVLMLSPSGCCDSVGRFKTSDPEGVVIGTLKCSMLNIYDMHISDIDTEHLHGWLSW